MYAFGGCRIADDLGRKERRMRLIDLDDSAHSYHGGMEMWSIDTEKTIEAIPVSYFASELAEIKLILQRKDISKTYREELEAEKRYLVGWINHWRWETGRGCRGWTFQPLSDDEIIDAERKEE